MSKSSLTLLVGMMVSSGFAGSCVVSGSTDRPLADTTASGALALSADFDSVVRQEGSWDFLQKFYSTPFTGFLLFFK